MSKKLRGHKPACKCVGCSAETRRRGMKALGLSKNPPRKAHKGKTKRAIAKSIKRHAKKTAALVKPRKRRKYKKLLRKIAAAKCLPNRKRRARHSNPAGNLIGTSVVIHSSRGRTRGARLLTGPGENRFTVLGTGSKRIDGARVKAVDYRHDAKAMRAYGRIAPFRHRFTSPAHVLSSGGGRIVIQSSRRIWEKQS